MEKRLEAHTFSEFIKTVQEHVKDGWLIDFNDNASIPVAFIGLYRCKVHKGEKVAALLKAKEVDETVTSTITTADILAVEPEHVVQPFVPSVVFTVEQPEAPAVVKKAVGRPKAQQV